MQKFRYGAGVFKVDWALAEPAPFVAERARGAGTVHLGNSYEEIEAYEQSIWKNDSVETEITYIDDEDKKHIVWFEDMDSVQKKQKYLQLFFTR